jgi:hypothetical protein
MNEKTASVRRLLLAAMSRASRIRGKVRAKAGQALREREGRESEKRLVNNLKAAYEIVRRMEERA